MTIRSFAGYCCVRSLSALAASVSASNWPMFRGPLASGIADDVSLAFSWNAPTGTRVKWRAPIPGLSHASPIVWGDRVYVLSAVAEGSTLDMKAEGVVFAKDTVQHEWRLHALDRDTGRERWVRVVHRGTPRQPRHVRATYANATPATDGTRIALVLANEGLFVLDMEGKLLWRKEMAPSNPEFSLDPASSPVIVDDAVIVQNDWQQGGFVAAFDLATGNERWRVARDEGLSWSTPGVFESAIRQADRAELVALGARAEPARRPRALAAEQHAKGSWDRVVTPIASEGLLIIAGGGGDRPIFAVRPSASGDISLPPNQRASEADRLDDRERFALHADTAWLSGADLRLCEQRRPVRLPGEGWVARLSEPAGRWRGAFLGITRLRRADASISRRGRRCLRRRCGREVRAAVPKFDGRPGLCHAGHRGQYA